MTYTRTYTTTYTAFEGAFVRGKLMPGRDFDVLSSSFCPEELLSYNPDGHTQAVILTWIVNIKTTHDFVIGCLPFMAATAGDFHYLGLKQVYFNIQSNSSGWGNPGSYSKIHLFKKCSHFYWKTYVLFTVVRVPLNWPIPPICATNRKRTGLSKWACY